MLALGPFQGAMTPHTRIPLNQGICGAAASTGKTVVVDDVSLDNRYLACSTETKSEIVVPVFVRGKVVGELDIDSHFPAAFGDDDRKLVEYCASLVGKQLEKLATDDHRKAAHELDKRQHGLSRDPIATSRGSATSRLLAVHEAGCSSADLQG